MVLLRPKSVLSTVMVLTQTALLFWTSSIRATTDEVQEIYQNYRPLAMDESVQLVKGSLGDGTPPRTIIDKAAPTQTMTSPDLPVNSDLPDRLDEPLDSNIRDPNVDADLPIEISSLKPGQRVTDTLLRLPETETPQLTRLITGPETATFIGRKVIKPSFKNVGPDDKDGKVLATYKILVPIYIPAVKMPKKVRMPPPKVEFRTEKHIKMIPVTKNVPRVKTYYKAERVPQQIVTDFVKADGTSVPSSVDDKLRPDEQVLKSVVTNYE